jgi:hypothetical protein
MTTTTEDYPHLPEKLAGLGCTLPAGLIFLPNNLQTAESVGDFKIAGEVSTLKKVLKAGGLNASILAQQEANPHFIHNKSHDWAMPAILFTAETIRANPDIVSLVLDLVKGHLVDFFKGLAADKTIKAEIVVERDKHGTYQKISYEGGIEGLKAMAEMAKNIHGQS